MSFRRREETPKWSRINRNSHRMVRGMRTLRFPSTLCTSEREYHSLSPSSSPSASALPCYEYSDGASVAMLYDEEREHHHYASASSSLTHSPRENTPCHVSESGTSRPRTRSALPPHHPKREGGLSYFFSGFAAGEDMVPLIHALKEALHVGCTGEERARVAPGNHHTSVPVSPFSPSARVVEDSPQEKRTQQTTTERRLTASAQGPVRGEAALGKPFNKYQCVSLEATKEQCTHAAKTALLFSLESTQSVDAATELYCAAEVQDLLHPHRQLGGQGTHGRTAAHRPSSFFLSEKVILKKARDSLRRYQHDREASQRQRRAGAATATQSSPVHDAHHHHHTPTSSTEALQLALSLLEQAPVTPHTQSLYLEALSFTTQWETAMRVLLNGLTPPAWSEMDVSMGMQCLRRAAAATQTRQTGVSVGKAERRAGIRAHTIARALHEADCQEPTDAHAQGRQKSRTDKGRGHYPQPLATCPLRLLRLAREHQLSFSTPSAVNDALGVIGHLTRTAANPAPAPWHEACRIVEEFLLPLENVGRQGTNAEMSSRGAAAAASTAASRSPTPVRPNVVTIYQLCRAFPPTQWARALAYSQALLAHYEIAVGEDLATMEQLLRTCMAGGRWEEALQLLRRGAAVPGDAAVTGGILGYRASFFLQLIQFFSEHLPSPLTVQSLLTSVYGPGGGASASASTAATLQLSKFYNEDVVLRAYNALLQHSNTVEEAERLAYSILTSQRGSDAPNKEPHPRAHDVSPSDMAAFQRTFLTTDDARVENESYARLTQLYATAGQWHKAVHAFQMLCSPGPPSASTEAPLRRARARMFLPTAQLHDTVQYAMEQAPLPGPSWHASLGIFMHLTEELQVPVSPVAFRCVAKVCSRQHAGDVAQRLFQYVIRQGVH